MSEVIDQANVLLVDDVPANLLSLEALLAQPGIATFKALSGEQALDLLLRHEFALAIVDVQMPRMSGFELAELMRGTERTRRVPIVFVSAGGHELDYAFQGYEHGAVDFLHKPLDLHAVRGKVSVFVDLYRNRKHLARQLEANEQSRHEQQLLLDALRSTQAELEAALRLRDEFMSIVSHELKTPLNALVLEVQLRRMQLARDPQPSVPRERLEAMVTRDERQVRGLVRLIDDMLDVSRIRTGKLSIQPQSFDMAALVWAVAGSFRDQLAAVGSELRVECEGPAAGVWDEFRIEQVLANLLTNAMRYGAGGPVTLSLGVAGDEVRLAVRDQGIGIGAQDLERIFRAFERGPDERCRSGLGLGLFIVEQIVQAHGGRIEVQSQVGEGTLFTVSLPREPLAPAGAAASSLAQLAGG